MPRMGLLAALALFACKNSENPDEPDVSPTPVTILPTGAPQPRPGDEDGDGLETVLEDQGYTLLVNVSGVPGEYEERLVVTDPAVFDTDGDGLSDLQERTFGTDGTREDTDGDGLTDLDELGRWGTSPTHVDSDGDSTGGAVGTTAPLSDLFDGAELQLIDVAGVMRAGPEATSPLFADSDGDGASDHREHLSPTRSPIIADRPEAVARLAPGTDIDMSMNIVWGEQLNHTETYTTSTSTSSIDTSVASSESTLETSTYGEIGFGLNVEATAGASANAIGADVSVEAWGEVIAGNTMKGTQTFGFSHEHRRERSRGSGETDAQSRGENYAYDSGTIEMALEIENTGPLAFTFSDLSVTASTLAPGARSFRPLTLLQAAPDLASTLAPGESTTMIVSDSDVNPDRMLELFESTALRVAPSSMNLLDADELDFDFALEDVFARTTSIEIDDGSGDVKRFHLATDIDRLEDGSLAKLTIREVLQRLGIDASSDTSDVPVLYTIDGVESQTYTSAANFSFLDPLGYPVTGAPPEPRLERAWFVYLRRESSFPTELPLDLLDSLVGPGDRVFMNLSVDADHDGILAAEEALHGCSDGALDSDGDGLSDWWELREGGFVTTEQVSFAVASSPSTPDTDGDGIDDLLEFQLGLSPQHEDTDGDGYLDGYELQEDHLDPLVFDFITIPVITCSTDPSSGALNIEVHDAEGDVTEVTMLMDIRMDVDATLHDGTAYQEQNARMSVAFTYDPPLQATWSTLEEGYPAMQASAVDRAGAPVDHSASLQSLLALPGAPWLTQGPLSNTFAALCGGTTACQATFSDVLIEATVDSTDFAGNTYQTTCVVGTP